MKKLGLKLVNGSSSLVTYGELFVFISKFQSVILYHWTLNIDKLKKSGFRDHHSRHKDEIAGVCFTDQLMGGPDSIRPGMRLVTVEMPVSEIEPYEEKNEGSDYRTFNISADIVNQCVLKFPMVYSDCGVHKIKGG